MLRTAVSLCLLALLALPLAPAHAQPTWWFWLSQPERHGSRKMAGDFRPVYSSYRFHSRERRGLFGFLHRGGRPNLARHHGHAKAPAAPRKSRTTL